MMKMNEKMDQILALSDPPPPKETKPDFRRVMNRTFKQLKSEVNPEQSYTGQEVIDIFAACIKSSTESMIQSSTNK